jgi:hypothetical protein
MLEFNSWGVSYSMISFFECALRGHGKVASFRRVHDIQFLIEHVNGTIINMLLVNEYSLGLAAVLRAREEFPDAEYIVTGGNWNGYTPEAKDFGRQNNLGIFNAGEFFGALNWTNPKSYYQKDRDENPIYAYKST